MNCIFCKIIAGELPSFKVYENDQTLAFLDIHPVAPGHTLVIPKKHSTNIFDIDSADWAAVAESVRTVAATLEAVLAADGINLVMNNREHAGQVVDHSHMHIIPRHQGDGLRQWSHRPYKDGEAEAVLGKIQTAIG